jgi:hypothetical protein
MLKGYQHYGLTNMNRTYQRCDQQYVQLAGVREVSCGGGLIS